MKKKFVIPMVAGAAALMLLSSKYTVVYVDALNDTTTTKRYGILEAPVLEPLETDNYKFAGWQVEDGSDTKIWHFGTTRLNAQWKPKQYAISYNLQDGEAINDRLEGFTFSPDEAVKLPTASKEHYDFAGWTIEGNEEVLTELPKAHSGNTVLTPAFTPASYKIEYLLNGGKLKGDEVASYEYGSTPDLPTPVKANHTFTGWLTSDDVPAKDFTWDKDVQLKATWKKNPPVVRKQPAQVKQQEQSYQQAPAVSNDPFEGVSNYARVGGHDMTLTWWGSQTDCDRQGNGVVAIIRGMVTIGDHNHQGFSVISSMPIGSTATICIDGAVREVTLRSRYSAINNGSYLELEDGTPQDEVGDGDIVMYTCKPGSTGRNIYITYWS